MTEPGFEDERPRWPAAVARWISPAGVLLAAVLFLVLPAVGAACGGDGPIGECWAGRQFVTGTPSVDTSRILAAPSVLKSLVDTAALPAGARLLAVLTLLVLAAGVVASAAIPRPLRRSAAMVACTLAGTVLLVVTEIVATTGLAHNIRDIPGAFTIHPDVSIDDIVSTGPGFWSALTVLTVTTLVSIGVFDSTRRSVAEAEFRTPA